MGRAPITSAILPKKDTSKSIKALLEALFLDLGNVAQEERGNRPENYPLCFMTPKMSPASITFFQ